MSLVSAALLTFAAGTAFAGGAAPAAADPVERCNATTGALVAVDFGPFGGKLEKGCDTTPTTGYELLQTAGFTMEGTVHDGPAFICRIGKGTGTRYPTPDREDCVLTPQATAYWSYWTASPGQRKWSYSQQGAMTRTPRPGDVEAWVYGGTDIAGTKGKPSFSPDDIRGFTTPDPTVPTAPPKVPAGRVDVAAATRWVTGALTDGERVVDEGSTTPNHLLSTEAVFALTAADRKSPVARKIADFLATPAQTDAYAYPAGKDGIPDATAASRLALVAEATGKDPRAFGGHDLLGDLVKYACPRDIGDGETVEGCYTKGDFRAAGQADAQAMAVIALVNAGMAPPPHSVSRLTHLQCEDGGFTSILIRPGAPNCESEAGATGLIALALERAGGHEQVLQKARNHLKRAQLPTGAWPGVFYETTGSPFATAWAAQALRALGDEAFADAGVSWLARRQLPPGGFGFGEEDTEPRLYPTATATLAGAGSDLAAVTAKPAAPPTTPPAGEGPDVKKGVAYLTAPSRLIQGRFYDSGKGFADYGMTIDGAYSLAATGGDNAALRRIVDFMDKGGKDGQNRGIHDWTLIGTKYANGGSLGKTAVLAEAVGRDPRDFGGKDLIAALAKITCQAKTAAPQECAAKGNYAYATSVFKQSLGVMAQLRAGEKAAAAEPVAYLKSLQTPSGAWVSLIGEPSGPEVDSTAMAAMTVDLLPDAGSQAAVDKALAWLATQQKEDGGFPGASGNSVNSAALAVQGLSLDAPKYATQIARARKFLASQQNADGGFNVAEDGQAGSDLRASAQAVGGATGISFGTLARDLTGTTPEPIPGTTGGGNGGNGGTTGGNGSPVIVTPGETGGGSGSGSGPGSGSGSAGGSASGSGSPSASGGGPLASTGAQAGALAAAALALTLGGWGLTRAARRRRTAPGSEA